MLLQKPPKSWVLGREMAYMGLFLLWEIIALFVQPLWDLSHIPVSRLKQYIKTDTAAENLKQPRPWIGEQKSEEI